jgi:hypothetical protein
MQDLVEKGANAVMVVWPKPLPGTNRTPSPFVDQLKHKSNELRVTAGELNDVKSKLNMQQLVEEESHCHRKQRGKAQKTKPSEYSE